MSIKKAVFSIVLLLICTMLVIGFAGIEKTVQENPVVFTGKEDHSISLKDASVLTYNYRQTVAADAKTGGFFGKDAIQAILNQDGCVGIRYYYGIDKEGTPVLVLVGSDARGNDMYEGVLAEMARPCPPACSNANPLNSFPDDFAANSR